MMYMMCGKEFIKDGEKHWCVSFDGHENPKDLSHHKEHLCKCHYCNHKCYCCLQKRKEVGGKDDK